jgi:hypothetical protein
MTFTQGSTVENLIRDLLCGGTAPLHRRCPLLRSVPFQGG